MLFKVVIYHIFLFKIYNIIQISWRPKDQKSPGSYADLTHACLPASLFPHSAPPSRVELTGFFIKVTMTCSSVFITNFKWLSVVQFAMITLLTSLYFTWVRWPGLGGRNVDCGLGFSLYFTIHMGEMAWGGATWIAVLGFAVWGVRF